MSAGLVVLCGPSGTGKSTLLKKLMGDFPNRFGFSISHTTRGPRPGEVGGKDYYFVERSVLEREVAEGLFLESAEVHGNYYGTSFRAIEEVMKNGKICLLDIDVQGAESVKRSSLNSKARYLFIAPPSFEVLEARLRGRGTETEEKIQKRLAGAKTEMAYMGKPSFWDGVIVNEGLEKAHEDFFAFMNTHCQLTGKKSKAGGCWQYVATMCSR
mmetsp:Transcript_26623/g.75156  ORF Transcript_26623/g.75156 Transcript_26623/m.75156 type:complete len:213 (+) Transcript_26623:73-711(+)